MECIDEHAGVGLRRLDRDPLGRPRIRDLRPGHELKITGQAKWGRGFAEGREGCRQARLIGVVARNEDGLGAEFLAGLEEGPSQRRSRD